MTLESLTDQEPGPVPADQIATPVSPLAKKINAEALIGTIVTRDDFVEIDGKIEPKRDLTLKLFTTAKLNYDTQLLSTMSMGNTILIAVKARVYQDNRAGKKVAEGLGGCTTEETKSSGKRAYHDALARAETRAFKRALEAAVGLPFINTIILRLFGGYEEVKPKINQGGIAEDRLIEVLKGYIDRIDNVGHLENWGKKYVDLVHLLSEEGRRVCRAHYIARWREFRPVPKAGELGPCFEEIREVAKRAKGEEEREIVQDLVRELTEEQRGEVERVLGEQERVQGAQEQDYEDEVREG